jgi:hypothetical protein
MKAIPSKVAAVNAHHIDGSVISASEHHLVESRCKAHSPFTCFFVDFCTLCGITSAVELWSQTALFNGTV